MEISVAQQKMTISDKCLTDLKLLKSDIVSKRKMKCKRSSIKKNIYFILKKFIFYLFILLVIKKLNITN